jgi:uncharacterized damage-inducible protein DinB
MPVAHSLLQVKEDLQRLSSEVPDARVWLRVNGAASIGFHVRHIARSTDRLLTYARGETLTADQVALARSEADAGAPLRTVVEEAYESLDRALEQIRQTPHDALLTERLIGRAKLPSTTLGLLVHAAEHATRHMGQAVTTAKLLASESGTS